MEEKVKERTIAQGAGSGLDADTFRRKLPSYFAESGGSLTIDFSVLNALIAGYIEGPEIADAAAPAANSGRIYFRDNGAGKTQLCVRFATGAIQVLATQP